MEVGENPENHSALSLQESVLACGMLYAKKTVTDYSLARNGSRVHSHTVNENEYDALVKEFQHDPFKRLAYGRANLRSIMQDENLPKSSLESRVKRYTDSYLALIVKLDRSAFPPNERVSSGIPEYIPDGLSDMGSDAKVDPRLRDREKIRVDKAKIFERAKPLFYEIFSKQFSAEITREQWKKFVTARVAQFVYESMPYNEGLKMHEALGLRSVSLNEVIEKKLSVCRHHALATQVLLQAFGITSRLMKSDVDFNGKIEPHANNLVRIEGQWYLLDSTNPQTENGLKKVFMKPLPEKTIDLNTTAYAWKFPMPDRNPWTYKSRTNMHYRIRDNAKPY